MFYQEKRTENIFFSYCNHLNFKDLLFHPELVLRSDPFHIGEDYPLDSRAFILQNTALLKVILNCS